MNTWTCKGLAVAVTCLALSGCEGGFTLPAGLQATSRTAPVLRMADLGRGAVTLVPPQGYCVDPASLQQRFAVMARCDTLGDASGDGAPLALITATTITAATQSELTADDLGSGAETILQLEEREALTLVQVQGAPPRPELRDVYWRTAGKVGDQIVGLTIYEVEGGISLGPLAPELLQQTMQRTQDQTIAKAVASADKSATTRNKATQRKTMNGLFE